MRSGLVIPYPWTFTVGAARSGIALATLATLAATPTSSLFRPLRGMPDNPACEGLDAMALFCVSGSGGRELAKWLAVGLLLLTATGWRPRLTALPHWWVSFSMYQIIATPDGGDQLASVATLALIPYCLLHPGRWHWSREVVAVPAWRAASAASALVAIKVQMSFLYFQASVSKFSHPEWADGTALYYYLSAPNLGAASWLDWPLSIAFSSGLVVAMLTWVPLAIELALAVTLLTRRAARIWLLVLGTAFHGTIALTMGLWTFSTIMVCCLLVFTIPVGGELRPDRAWWSRLRRRPGGEGTVAAAPERRTKRPAVPARA
jgi:antimicrobial peptide system SdpB family protein